MLILVGMTEWNSLVLNMASKEKGPKGVEMGVKTCLGTQRRNPFRVTIYNLLLASENTDLPATTVFHLQYKFEGIQDRVPPPCSIR